MVPTAPAIATAAAELTLPKGIGLSHLMKSVTGVVAQAYRNGIWTQVKVSRTDTRGGHVYLKFAKRDAQSAAVAQARASRCSAWACAPSPMLSKAISRRKAPRY